MITVCLVFVICWLALIAYLVLLGDLLVPIVELVDSNLADMQDANLLRVLVTCAATLVLSPMCFKGSMHALRFLCFASVTSVVIVGVVIARRAVQR